MTSVEILLEFENKVSIGFSPFIENYGFCLHNHFEKIDSFGFSDFQYKRAGQYIAISLSLLPQDSDIGISVRLWADDNPATSLNFVVQYLTQADTYKTYNFYNFQIENSLTEIKEDLTLHLKDFLHGDLKTYHFVANANRGLT